MWFWVSFSATKWNNVLFKFLRPFLQRSITDNDNDKCIVMLLFSSQNPSGVFIIFCLFLILTGLSAMAFDIEHYNSTTTNWLNKSDIQISDLRQAVTVLKKVMGNIRYNIIDFSQTKYWILLKRYHCDNTHYRVPLMDAQCWIMEMKICVYVTALISAIWISISEVHRQNVWRSSAESFASMADRARSRKI